MYASSAHQAHHAIATAIDARERIAIGTHQTGDRSAGSGDDSAAERFDQYGAMQTPQRGQPARAYSRTRKR